MHTHTMNGKAHRNGTTPQPAVALRIFRVEPGQVVHMRTLSPAYSGLMIHYQKRSLYCPGEAHCPPAMHKCGLSWKGYAAVELYDKNPKLWVPFVLEITEALELDFRDVWKRGQVWKLWREAQDSKKPTPIQGKLQETLDGERLRPEFDILPPLYHLYHTTSVQLGWSNPMPPRTFLEAIAGDAPAELAEQGHSRHAAPSADDVISMRESWEARRRSPSVPNVHPGD